MLDTVCLALPKGVITTVSLGKAARLFWLKRSLARFANPFPHDGSPQYTTTSGPIGKANGDFSISAKIRATFNVVYTRTTVCGKPPNFFAYLAAKATMGTTNKTWSNVQP